MKPKIKKNGVECCKFFAAKIGKEIFNCMAIEQDKEGNIFKVVYCPDNPQISNFYHVKGKIAIVRKQDIVKTL